jgi:hypothetical protein
VIRSLTSQVEVSTARKQPFATASIYFVELQQADVRICRTVGFERDAVPAWSTSAIARDFDLSIDLLIATMSWQYCMTLYTSKSEPNTTSFTDPILFCSLFPLVTTIHDKITIIQSRASERTRPAGTLRNRTLTRHPRGCATSHHRPSSPRNRYLFPWPF